MAASCSRAKTITVIRARWRNVAVWRGIHRLDRDHAVNPDNTYYNPHGGCGGTTVPVLTIRMLMNGPLIISTWTKMIWAQAR